MSGGSHDYIYSKIEFELCDQMEDDELNELVADFAKVAHDLEWWKSGDIEEDDYRETVNNFKLKWFGLLSHAREVRLFGYATKKLTKLRDELNKLLEECK